MLLAASTIGSIAWGYLGDHIGHKKVVEGGTLCTGLAAAGALLVHGTPIGILGYGAVFILVGLATSAIQLAAFTFVIDFAPEEKRPTYVGVASLASVPFTASAPLVAGAIADRAGYPVIFAITVVLAFAAAFLVWNRVVDPRMTEGTAQLA